MFLWHWAKVTFLLISSCHQIVKTEIDNKVRQLREHVTFSLRSYWLTSSSFASVEHDSYVIRVDAKFFTKVKMNMVVDLVTTKAMPFVEVVLLSLSRLENVAVRIGARNPDDIFLGDGRKMNHVGLLEKK
ncbi:hypothetical protein V6N11_001527 [Hibiscus sabdariffa]|uniref:Uncharacterized protein n=1 Tax=Hibiscus sabdariffa TaxID=183260 RepID=A0ABR2S005_9ROSI